MEESELFQRSKTVIANSLEQARMSANQIKQRAEKRIDEYQDKIIILKEKNLPREEYLQELEKLIDSFENEKDDDDAREEKKDDPEQFTGSRNKFIIKAELDAHLSNYDDNWDKNTHYANGKYTSEKKKEWLAKKEELEAELRNCVN